MYPSHKFEQRTDINAAFKKQAILIRSKHCKFVRRLEGCWVLSLHEKELSSQYSTRSSTSSWGGAPLLETLHATAPTRHPRIRIRDSDLQVSRYVTISVHTPTHKRTPMYSHTLCSSENVGRGTRPFREWGITRSGQFHDLQKGH